MQIYCCNCETEVDARLTDGSEVYPHRRDLYELPFWKCDTCEGIVGCHHKTKERTKPLGVIPSQIIKEYRKKIHSYLDPLWKQRGMSRKTLYKELSELLGTEYHTAELRTEEQCKLVLDHISTTYYPI